MRSFKKAILRQRRVISDTPSLRYLISVSANPNSGGGGGCSLISVSFEIPGDDPVTYSWNIDNAGEVIVIDSCIDLNTLTYNCIGRIDFQWNDEITC